jgi:simple sugar transport system substrate-binding protein
MQYRRIALAAAAAALAVAGAGCAKKEEGGAGGAAKTSGAKIIVVTHGQASDPFWSVVKKGVDTAAGDMNANVEYRAPEKFDPVAQRRLIDGAIASKPDGLVVSLADVDALGPSVRKATSQGIPVVVINSGGNAAHELGAIAYVGQTELAAGEGAGKQLAEAGVTKGLCVNQEQGNVALDQRCEGFKKGLAGNVTQIAVDGTDPVGSQQKITTALRSGKYDGVLALGPTGADPTLKALEASGKAGTVKMGTFDLSPTILQNVANGKIVFAVDQQPYLQGYLPIVMLSQYKAVKVVPASDVASGPAFVTKENASEVIDLTKKGLR